MHSCSKGRKKYNRIANDEKKRKKTKKMKVHTMEEGKAKEEETEEKRGHA